MKKKIFGYIMREINRLTKDEDLRQELWLYFLEGNCPFSFPQHLSHIQDKQLIDNTILTYVDMESLNGIEEKF